MQGHGWPDQPEQPLVEPCCLTIRQKSSNGRDYKAQQKNCSMPVMPGCTIHGMLCCFALLASCAGCVRRTRAASLSRPSEVSRAGIHSHSANKPLIKIRQASAPNVRIVGTLLVRDVQKPVSIKT